jgi:hypothetical protein
VISNASCEYGLFVGLDGDCIRFGPRLHAGVAFSDQLALSVHLMQQACTFGRIVSMSDAVWLVWG